MKLIKLVLFVALYASLNTAANACTAPAADSKFSSRPIAPVTLAGSIMNQGDTTIVAPSSTSR